MSARPLESAICLLLLICCCFSLSQAQFFYHQGLSEPAASSSYEPASAYQGYATADAHPAVAQLSQWEAELPAELSNSARFLNDPRTAAFLAKDSLLTRKEMAVVNREADKIPREQVYKLFKNAGWLSRR